MDYKIGVIVDSFRVGFKESVEKARKVGAQGIQMYATNGDMAPENLSTKRRKEILDIVKSNGLVFSAICGDFGSPGFCDAKENIVRVERSKRVLNLAKELESSVITTHIGPVPDDDNSDRWKTMQLACDELGEYADNMEAFFAIETGPENSLLLKKFLDSLRSSGIRVNFDPANLAMVIGEDPCVAVKNLGPYIVHTHAKDGVMLKQGNREAIYGIIEDILEGPYFKEVPLGEGSVDFDKYLVELDKYAGKDFNRFLTIEREVGDDPERDIRNAVEFLKKRI